MLNYCARTLWRCQPLKQTTATRILALQNYSSFTIKDVLYETTDDAGTLLSRFAKHVALERQKICDQVPSVVKYSDYFPLSDMRYFEKELRKTPKEQIATVIIYASTYRSNAEPAKFAVVLNELDRCAFEHVEDMSADTILRTLYAFLFLIPNWMTRLDFYGRAMQRLHEEFNEKGAVKSKELFVQLCFYMGLSKKQTKHNISQLINTLLNEHINHYLKEMSTLDIALVGNAAYKTANTIENEEFDQRLLKEVLDISNSSNGNDALMVTFIKSMRLQRLKSVEVCQYITKICQDTDQLQQLQTTAQAHMFAYLAENLWDSKECTQPLIETFTEQLTISRNSNNYSQKIRGKDIARFLWSCAQLNCKLSSVQFRTIENSLLEKLNTKEFQYFTDQLIESCLSLWILGYKPKELVQAAVQLKSTSTNKRHQPKVDSRLTVLLAAAQIEEPDWCSTLVKGFEGFNMKAKVPSYLLNNHNVPYQEIINQLLKEESVVAANIVCPINGINLPGIHIKFSNPEHSEQFIEFLTPSQTLHFSGEPSLVLRLKLRLLESLGHKVKVLSSTDVLDPRNLKNALSDVLGPGELINEPSKSSIKA